MLRVVLKKSHHCEVECLILVQCTIVYVLDEWTIIIVYYPLACVQLINIWTFWICFVALVSRVALTPAKFLFKSVFISFEMFVFMNSDWLFAVNPGTKEAKDPSGKVGSRCKKGCWGAGKMWLCLPYTDALVCDFYMLLASLFIYVLWQLILQMIRVMIQMFLEIHTRRCLWLGW